MKKENAYKLDYSQGDQVGVYIMLRFGRPQIQAFSHREMVNLYRASGGVYRL